LQAQYLDRQSFNKKAFRQHLNYIINADDGLMPDFALLNSVAKRKAQHLLKMEEQWF